MPQFLRLPWLTWLLLLANFPNFVIRAMLVVEGTAKTTDVVGAVIIGLCLIAIYVYGRKTQQIDDRMKQYNLHDFGYRGVSSKDDIL